jgi:hypothetical protein
MPVMMSSYVQSISALIFGFWLLQRPRQYDVGQKCGEAGIESSLSTLANGGFFTERLVEN